LKILGSGCFLVVACEVNGYLQAIYGASLQIILAPASKKCLVTSHIVMSENRVAYI